MKGNELKPRIGFFGRMNVGKSTMVNYLTGQQTAIVSDTPGTTTDPVRKSMEISGVGPVILIDTAGIDDSGELGQQRIEKSMAVLEECDLVLLLHWDTNDGEPEENVRRVCQKRNIPFIEIDTKVGIPREELIKKIRNSLPNTAYNAGIMLGDVITEGDVVVLVTPIDSSAPEGRMILPQVQVLRDLMDCHATAIFCQPSELKKTLECLKEKPRLVVTDSQMFHLVAEIVPEDVYLTSFSVVLARQKGLFKEYVEGTPTIESLKDGDRVLLLESCTHNVTCEDIGRVKLPKLLAKYTGKKLVCEVLAGQDQINRPLNDYRLVIQCGGCVVGRQQLRARLQQALEANVPVSNYGLAIAYMNRIFERSMRIFKTMNIK